MWLFTSGITFEDLSAKIAAILIVVFITLPLHEIVQGLVADKLGDSTAKYNGQLTLNPLLNFDIIGAISVIICGFGWSKPVTINPFNFKNPRKDTALVAFFGMMSHILSAIIGGILYNLLFFFKSMYLSWFLKLLVFCLKLNIGIAVFNLVPIYPLDGFKILGAFLSERALVFYHKHHFTILIITYFLLISGVLGVPLSILENLLFRSILSLTSLPFSLLGIA